MSAPRSVMVPGPGAAGFSHAFGPTNTLNVRFIEEATMLALAWYSSQPPAFQAQASETFRSMDRDGNGNISLDELKASQAYTRLAQASTPAEMLMHALDSDGNGTLNFHECITLFYLLAIRGGRACRNCGTCILKIGFTCTTCWQQRSPSAPATFDLCQDCFFAKAFRHPHETFLDEYQMYNLMMHHSTFNKTPSVPKEQVACRVCGESHCKDSPSYLLKDGTHLIKDTIKADSFICEWCLCWQCSRCNVFFKGQTCSARPSQWLENTRFCGRCGGQKKQGVDIRALLEEVEYKHGSKSCDSCNIKIRNGILFPLPLIESSSEEKPLFDNAAAMQLLATGIKSLQMGEKLCHNMLKKEGCNIM